MVRAPAHDRAAGRRGRGGSCRRARRRDSRRSRDRNPTSVARTHQRSRAHAAAVTPPQWQADPRTTSVPISAGTQLGPRRQRSAEPAASRGSASAAAASRGRRDERLRPHRIAAAGSGPPPTAATCDCRAARPEQPVSMPTRGSPGARHARLRRRDRQRGARHSARAARGGLRVGDLRRDRRPATRGPHAWTTAICRTRAIPTTS